MPPQGVPQVLLDAKELTNEAGFVDVDRSTLQHVKYSNVFALGDCSSSPNSKTMAAIGKFYSYNERRKLIETQPTLCAN